MRKLIDYLSTHLIATSVVVLFVKTLLVTVIAFKPNVLSWMDVVLIFFGPLGTIMLLIGCAFLFGKRLKPRLLLIIYTILTFILYANLLYYRFYIDFVTLSVLFQLSNVGGLGPSTVELLSPFDVLIWADVFLIGYLGRVRRRSQMLLKPPNKKTYALAGAGLIAATFALALFQSPYLLKTDYDRDLLVKSLGLYNYQLVNISYGLIAPVEKALADQSEAEEVSTHLQKHEGPESDFFGVGEGKNVVLISLESTQNFVINKTVNGEEITPFLNDLIGDSFYFDNVFDQTAQGKTADAEFMISTGLHPIPSGSAFVRYPDNTYWSLPKILSDADDYQSYAFHANDASFWNRSEMYDSLGYERFYSKPFFNVTDDNVVNYGLKDIPFFEQSGEQLQNLPEPYMAKLITLTNHFPFLLDSRDRYIDKANTEVDAVNRYMTTVRYEDEALKRLFEQLKENGTYEDTVFVIYGDHYGISKEYEPGVHEFLGEKETPLNHLQLQRVPVIIHVPGQKGKTIETIGGQVDIRPTLLDILGIRTDTSMTFGRNLLTRNEDQPVVFRDGSFVTKDHAYLSHVCYDRNKGQATQTSACSDDIQTARRELELSDSIIQKDLLRFLN